MFRGNPVRLVTLMQSVSCCCSATVRAKDACSLHSFLHGGLTTGTSKACMDRRIVILPSCKFFDNIGRSVSCVVQLSGLGKRPLNSMQDGTHTHTQGVPGEARADAPLVCICFTLAIILCLL